MLKHLLFAMLLNTSLTYAEDLEVYYQGNHGTIVGEEYWVFDDTKSGNPYSRNEIIWSYDEAPKVAQECAKKGHAQLKKWLSKKDSIVSLYLKLIGELGGVTNFFLWTNDYQTMNSKIKSQNPRPASVWNWQDMFLKYESTVLANGQCLIPKEVDVTNSLRRIAENREAQRVNDLNIVQRIFDGNRSISFQNKLQEINEQVSQQVRGEVLGQ